MGDSLDWIGLDWILCEERRKDMWKWMYIFMLVGCFVRLYVVLSIYRADLEAGFVLCYIELSCVSIGGWSLKH